MTQLVIIRCDDYIPAQIRSGLHLAFEALGAAGSFTAGERILIKPNLLSAVAPDLAVDEMLDAHRVLVDAADRLENLPQVARLLALGYAGPFSFEPFAAEVHDRTDIEAALADSMAHVAQGIAAPAARPLQHAEGS